MANIKKSIENPLWPVNPELAKAIPGESHSAVRDRDYRSLLLYIETLNVDKACEIDYRRCNAADLRILEFWDDEGFIRYQAGKAILSEAAIDAAHKIRRQMVVNSRESYKIKPF